MHTLTTSGMHHIVRDANGREVFRHISKIVARAVLNELNARAPLGTVILAVGAL